MIKHDFIASLSAYSVYFSLVVFGMVIYINIFGFIPALKPGQTASGVDSIPFFIGLGIIFLVIGVIVLFLRYHYLKSFFDTGKKV